MITYTIEIERDSTDVRGNALASGDDQVDREAEDEIIARINEVDIWAWARIRVIASEEERTGKSSWLGCCSYESEEDFRADDYFKDLCEEARSAMPPSQEKFDAALEAILSEMTGADLLSVPGIYEVVSEHFNNEAIERARSL